MVGNKMPSFHANNKFTVKNYFIYCPNNWTGTKLFRVYTSFGCFMLSELDFSYFDQKRVSLLLFMPDKLSILSTQAHSQGIWLVGMAGNVMSIPPPEWAAHLNASPLYPNILTVVEEVLVVAPTVRTLFSGQNRTIAYTLVLPSEFFLDVYL